MSVNLRMVLAIVLATIASAGLFASTSNDLQDLTAIYVSDVWLLPGLVLIGTLLATAIGEVGRSVIGLVAVAVLGSLLYGLAIAAPGLRVEGVRVTLIDRGTTYGLVALMLILLFGIAGIALSWVIGALVQGIGNRE